MTEVSFYHLTRSTVEQALPDLLEKTLAKGWRAVVRVKDAAMAEALAAQLWLYRQDSFLPHGALKDGHAEDQPIWITASEENPNGAQALFLLSGAGTERADAYQRICEVFDGNDDESVTHARTRWVNYKKDGHKLAYWQQGEKGWTNKSD